jgi:Flp pilus assembly protein TadG
VGSRRRGESGSATLELVVWAPALLLVMSVVLLAGRVAQAHQTVEVAAAEAARSASSADTLGTARSSAREAADRALASSGLRCGATTVTVDTGEWNRLPGVMAKVGVTVSCRVALADLAVPGLPGGRQVSASATSILDTFRVRR